MRFLFVCSLLFTGHLIAQPINKEFVNQDNSTILLGKVNQEGLSANNYSSWFLKNFNAYEPDQTAVDQFKEELPEYTVELFMGTWCGDSKREVPRFYKILKAAQFPLERLTTVAVDRVKANYKQSPGGEHEGKNIHRVPTFIFYKNGIEVNRITERPVISLEADLLQILQGRYTPNYSGVSKVGDWLEKVKPVSFEVRAKEILPELKSAIKSNYELNTYAKVLFYSDLKEKALEVFRLNTLLFPNEVSTHLSLANTLGMMEEYSAAIEAYKKVLKIDPENEEAISSIKYVTSKMSNQAGF